MALTEGDLPALYKSADAGSLAGQRLFIWGTVATLGLFVAAAVGGALMSDSEGIDSGALGATAAFFLALILQLELARRRPDREWYDGRAIAESAKSLAWQYGVRGGPYGTGPHAPTNPEQALRADLRSLISDLGAAKLSSPNASDAQVTARMKTLRDSDLNTRRDAYRAGRIGNQRAWYTRKAVWNRKSRNRWLLGLVAIQALGCVGAVLATANVIDFDILGISAAVAASVVAWVQAKDYGQLEEAYSVAAHDLGLIEAELDEPTTEEAWTDFVASAEQAISREHRVWRAARGARVG